MDTKLKTKDKTKFVLFFVLFLVLALGIGYGIYYLADVVFNGSVLEWFAENYFYIETKRIDGKNGPVYYFRPDWPKLKMLVLTIFFLLMVIFVVSIYLTAHFHARNQVQKSISKTSRMLLIYMHNEIDSNEVFPASYAEVASQIVQI